jgi:hypothetical protein
VQANRVATSLDNPRSVNISLYRVLSNNGSLTRSMRIDDLTGLTILQHFNSAKICRKPETITEFHPDGDVGAAGATKFGASKSSNDWSCLKFSDSRNCETPASKSRKRNSSHSRDSPPKLPLLIGTAAPSKAETNARKSLSETCDLTLYGQS